MYEVRGLSGGYRSQGYPIRLGLFYDTVNPPASANCPPLSYKPGNLSFSERYFKTTSLESIKFFIYNKSFKTNNLYLLQLVSVIFLLGNTYIILLHSVVLVSGVHIFSWASRISSWSLMISYRCHLWLPLEIPVCSLLPGGGRESGMGWWCSPL